MEKRQILKEIQHLADANDGKAPGRAAFETKTGIRMSDWYPHYWLRWSDALVEAGYIANKFQSAIGDETLILSFINFMRELGHIPIVGELQRKRKVDKSFPSRGTFAKFGGKKALLNAVLAYCNKHSGYEDILTLIQKQAGHFRWTERSNQKVSGR